MLPRRTPALLAAASKPWRSALRGLIGCAAAAAACALPAQAQRVGSALARDFGATWWSIANGLPQSSINALVQAEDGEMWIATHGGLLSFDGLEFRRFDIDTLPGLRSNRVTALADDGAGGLWFATQEGGLHHLREGRLVQSVQVPGSDGVLGLLRARDGSLWTQGTSGMLQRFADGAWTALAEPHGADLYRGLCTRGDGLVCAAIREELVLFEPSGVELARLPAPGWILSIAPAAADGVWIGLVDGLALARDGAIEPYRVRPAIDAIVDVIVDDGRGTVWLGTPGGVRRVATAAEESPPVRVHSSAELPRGFAMRSILLDKEGNTWLGGTEAGLIRLRPNRLDSYERVPGRSMVRAMCADGHGGAWVGYVERGLARIVPELGEEREQPLDVPGPDPPIVHSLLHDSRGRTWVGVNGSWMRSEQDDEEHFERLLPDHPFTPGVGPMAERPDGHVWISTVGGHLLRLGLDDEVQEELDLPVPIHVLAVAPDSSLWAGGVDEVYCVRDAKVTRFGPEHGLPFGTVRDILPEPNGQLWFATYGGGLALFSQGRARVLTTRNGLFDSSLSRILFDEQDRLWMLSNLGLIVAQRAELMAVLEGRRSRIDPVVIGPEAGLNEASSAQPGGFRDATGRMWFGMISGTIRIDAHEFPFNRTEPRVHIQSVRAEDVALDLAGSLEVPAGTRRLSFEFTAFGLSAPERMRFRYRLDGYDEDWLDVDGARRASYTALAPGGYTLRVTARNEDGVWSREPEALRFTILPAWWQTPVFRAVFVLAVLGVLFALHRMRVRIVQRRTQVLLEATQGRMLAEERSSRLREELAHVARVATAGELATSLAHEVNQPLAAIVTNAEAARRYLARDGASSADLDAILRDIAQQGERASEVIRRLRKFLRKHESERTPVDLNELVHATLPLLRRELEDHSAVVDLDLAEGLPSVGADPVQMQQVLVNLVKNACDAMSSHPGERRIRLRTRRAAAGVALEVEDSGPGIAAEVRERVFQPYVTTKPAGMGLGLAICRTIVEAHGGRLVLAGSSAAGASFRVDLPAEPGRKEPS